MTKRTGRRVALFIDSFDGGGAQRMTVNLANEFAARSFHVDLLVARRQGPFLDTIDGSVNIVDLNSIRVLPASLAVARYLRRYSPEALLAALTNVNLAALIAVILAGSKTRVVVSERNHLSRASRHAPSWRKRWLLPILVRALYWRAHAVVGISNGVVQDLIENYGVSPCKATTIYNPVLTRNLVPKNFSDLRPPHQWLREGEPPVILGVGRLVPQKDFETLIRAFRILREDKLARLLILGEGVERLHLENLVAELGLTRDVFLAGFVDNVMEYMTRVKVFVMSSAWEGFGNVLVEALACGVPVVSTDCTSGPSEILGGGVYGTLVPVGDASSLAAAVGCALDAPLSPDSLRKRAEVYRVERIADQYLQIML